MGKRVLIADNERITLEVLQTEFATAGFDVKTAEDAQGVLAEFLGAYFDLVLLTMELPGLSALELLRSIRAQSREVVVIVTTTFTDVETAVGLMKAGADDCITKPYDINNLIAEVKKLLSVPPDTQTRTASRAEESSLLYGDSVHMRQIRETVQKICNIPTTVLITGESGTGKGVLARAICQSSRRAQLPFVHVNCAAIPANLIESELFGHEAGSFTGAVKTHKGKFEMAGQGTVFLDEIGLMPLNLQSKLLNVLQERRFERIGGIKSHPLEARVIAATNVDLEQCVEDGLFRGDLYYRLNVVNIELPALRHRRDDILPLAKLFINRCQSEFGKEIESVSNDFYEALLQYNWPGNVRELENAMESAVALCDEGRLTLSSLPMRITQKRLDGAAPGESPSFRVFLKQSRPRLKDVA